MNACNVRSRLEVGSCERGEDMVDGSLVDGKKDVRFLMLPTSPQMKILGEPNGLTINEFIRVMKAEWRRGGWPEVDRVHMILDFVSTELRRELKLHDECSN